LESDELENRLFKESYNCRVFRIKDTIRGIGICLESESFAKSKLYFNSEISRVTQNTESANQRLGDLEESNRRDALARNHNEEDQEDNEYTDLDKRYFAEKRRLEDAVYNASVDQKFRAELIENIRAEEEEIERIEREEIDSEAEIRERVQNQFSDAIRREKEEIDSLEETIRTSIARELATTDVDIQFLGLLHNDIPRVAAEKFREQIETLDTAIERLGEHAKGLEKSVFSEFRTKIKFEESEIERIGKEEGGFQESAGREFDKEIESNARELPEGIGELLEGAELVYNYKDAQRKEERYKSAREFLGKRTWEKE
jgi:hypothetical protein